MFYVMSLCALQVLSADDDEEFIKYSHAMLGQKVKGFFIANANEDELSEVLKQTNVSVVHRVVLKAVIALWRCDPWQAMYSLQKGRQMRPEANRKLEHAQAETARALAAEQQRIAEAKRAELERIVEAHRAELERQDQLWQRQQAQLRAHEAQREYEEEMRKNREREEDRREEETRRNRQREEDEIRDEETRRREFYDVLSAEGTLRNEDTTCHKCGCRFNIYYNTRRDGGHFRTFCPNEYHFQSDPRNDTLHGTDLVMFNLRLFGQDLRDWDRER